MAKTNFFSKGIAFVTVAALTLSALPTVDSFASSTNKLSNGNLTVSEKTMFYEPGLGTKPTLNTGQSTVKYLTEGNWLNIKLDDAVVSSSGAYSSFDLELENAKFTFQDYDEYLTSSSAKPFNERTGKVSGSIYTRTGEYTLEVQGDDYATVKLAKDYAKDDIIKIPMLVRMNDDLTKGTAKVYVRGGNSGISSTTLSLATINKGSTNTYVNDYQTAKIKLLSKS